MQRYTIFFIAVSAVQVSGGFSAHHQELKIKNCTHRIWYMLSLLAATASAGELNSPTLAVAASKLDTYQMLRVRIL
jgi:hypothetical protein